MTSKAGEDLFWPSTQVGLAAEMPSQNSLVNVFNRKCIEQLLILIEQSYLPVFHSIMTSLETTHYLLPMVLFTF